MTDATPTTPEPEPLTSDDIEALLAQRKLEDQP